MALLHDFFDLTFFYRLGQKYKSIFVRFLVFCFRDLLTFRLLHWGSCNRQSNGFPICRKTLETILFERIGVFQMVSWFSEWVKILFSTKLPHTNKILYCLNIEEKQGNFFVPTLDQKMVHTNCLNKKSYLPYAHHYKPRLIFFYPIFHCGYYCRAAYNAQQLILQETFLKLKIHGL